MKCDINERERKRGEFKWTVAYSSIDIFNGNKYSIIRISNGNSISIIISRNIYYEDLI